MASSLLQMHKESQNEEPPPGNSPKPPPLRSSEGELDAGLAACGRFEQVLAEVQMVCQFAPRAIQVPHITRPGEGPLRVKQPLLR